MSTLLEASFDARKEVLTGDSDSGTQLGQIDIVGQDGVLQMIVTAISMTLERLHILVKAEWLTLRECADPDTLKTFKSKQRDIVFQSLLQTRENLSKMTLYDLEVLIKNLSERQLIRLFESNGMMVRKLGKAA